MHHLLVVDVKCRDAQHNSCYTCLCPRVWKLAACLGNSQTVSSAGDPERQPAWSSHRAQAAFSQSRYGLTLWSHALTTDCPNLPTETCRDTQALSCSITWSCVWQEIHREYAMFSLVWISENMSTFVRALSAVLEMCILGALCDHVSLFNTYSEFGSLPERLVRDEASVA